MNDNRHIFKPESVSAEERGELLSNRAHVWTQALADELDTNNSMLKFLEINRDFYSDGCPEPRDSFTTKSGVQIEPFATPISVPIKLEKGRSTILYVATYCPTSLQKCLQARKDGTGEVYKNNGGKHRHVMEFMSSDGTQMVASSIDLLHAGVGTKHFLERGILIECSPDAHPYRGDLSDVYPDDVAAARQDKYTKEVFLPAIEVAKNSNGKIKIQLISKGAKTFTIKAVGGKVKFRKLVREFPSLFLGGDPATGDVDVPNHPENFHNTKLIGADFPEKCTGVRTGLSDTVTRQVVHLTGDDSLRSDLGEQMLEKRLDSAGYQSLLAARKKLIERKKAQFKDGDAALQHHYYGLCLADGFHPELVTLTNAQSLYMQHLHSLGMAPLQLDAVEQCLEYGITGVTPSNAQSKLMQHLHSLGTAPLQLNHLEQCLARGIIGATPFNATSLLNVDKMKHNDHQFQLANLKKCQERGIDGATASNSTSLLQTDKMKHDEHNFQSANLKECQERGVVGATTSNAISLLQSDKMNAGDHNFQDHYLKMCQEKGITHDKRGEPVTAKNAQSIWMSTNSNMKNPAVAAAAYDTKLRKKLIKLTKGCTSKEEKKDKIMELFAVFECDKCKGKEQIGMIVKEKYCETAGCKHCHGIHNKTGKPNGNGVSLPQEPGIYNPGNKSTSTGESYNGRKGNPKNPRRKCWVFLRYLKPEEVATLLAKVEEG